MFAVFLLLSLHGPKFGTSIPAVLQELQDGIDGDIIDASDPQFSELSSQAWTYFDSIIPLAIIYCNNENDVEKTLEFIDESDDSIPFRIRSGGHNFNAFSKCQDPCVVIDVSRINNIEYDEISNKLTIGPGVNQGSLYEWLRANNYNDVIIPAGNTPPVAFGGLVQGGGHGSFSRRIGITCDYLISANIVLNDGELVIADEDGEYSDLFWAIRGSGGGNFGVVTQYTFSPKIDMPQQVMRYTITWIPEILINIFGYSYQDILEAFWKTTRDLLALNDDPGFSGFCAIVAPTQDTFFLSVFVLNFVYIPDGDADDDSYDFSAAYQLINEIKSNDYMGIYQFAPIVPSEVEIFGTPGEIMDVIHTESNDAFDVNETLNILTASEFVLNESEFNDQFIHDMVEKFYDEEVINPSLTNYEVTLVYNTYGRGNIPSFDVNNEKTSYVNRDAIGNIEFFTLYDKINEQEAFDGLKDWHDQLFLSDILYNNYMENLFNDTKRRDVYTDERVYQRLQQIKAKYDGDDKFNFPLSIPVGDSSSSDSSSSDSSSSDSSSSDASSASSSD